jgi:hypothetical protein
MAISGDLTLGIRLAALLDALEGRATGYWQVVGDRLDQVVFAGAADLPQDVFRSFAEATRTVALDRIDLGIVAAAVEGTVRVSRASELPPDSGSGYWLRAFGAGRSVAVPVRDVAGNVRAVCSVALAAGPLDDESIAERVAATAGEWKPPG